MAQPVLRTPENARTIGVMGDLYRFVLTGEETGGRLCVIDAIIPPGGGPPPHVHTHEDEIFSVLEGEITFLIGDKVTVAGPGTTVFAPRGGRHRFSNEGATPARFLITIMPAGFEQMFIECGEELPAGSTTPVPVSEAMIAKIVEQCPRYGVTLELPS